MPQTKAPKFHGIIPARYDASRFPGKPLTPILGKPMIWHVYQRAKACGQLSQVVLATDDERIMTAARQYDIPALMTRKDHASGTDRVLEAARKLSVSEHDVVVNIQGDEPALDPAMLSQLVAPFSDPQVRVATLARRICGKEAENPDRVKVVFGVDGDALYFSRSPIPYPAKGKSESFFLHVGLYAFRKATLERFSELGPGQLETMERLEQLRLLENNIPIRVVVTECISIGVDRPEDVAVVSRHLAAMNHKTHKDDLSTQGAIE